MPSLEEQKLTTMIQTEPLLTKLKSLNWSSTQNQKALDSSQQSTAQVTWMPCSSLWKNLESRILKPTLTRSPKQPWTLKTKRRWTLQSLPHRQVHGLLAGKTKIFNYGTDEYANDATNAQGLVLPQMGMDSMASLLSTLTPLLPWLKKEAFNQWPSTMVFYYEDKGWCWVW